MSAPTRKPRPKAEPKRAPVPVRVESMSLTAAAARYTGRKISRAKPVDQSWQLAAWSYYRTVPEVRFAGRWMGNAMSGVTLYAGYRADDGSIERLPPEHPASQYVAQIAGGPDGQAELMGKFGPHLTVAGEGWVIILPAPESASVQDPADLWRVLSVKEVQQQSGKLTAIIDGEPVEIPPADPEGPLDDSIPAAIRVWEPSPDVYLEADSAVRSSLDQLESLALLNAAVKAIARSRITGRGILLVPKGTRFPTAPGQAAAEDDLIEVLMVIAETAIKDPESAAATVPIVLEVPAETIPEFKLIRFDSDFDELAIKLRDEEIRRFATGLEIPAEVVLGLGDVNHWGQWALTSEAIRLGVEPKAKTVCRAFTTQWLRPLLEADGVEDAGRCLVWYDSSPLRVRTNRSETALKLFELGAISAAALRRETGFDEDDAPNADEIAARSKQPQDQPQDQVQEKASGPLPVDETTAEPDTLPASAATTAADIDLAGLLAAADGLIWGALSAAGEKLLRTPACPRSERAQARETTPAALHALLAVDADQIDQWRLLAGAWVRVPEIANRYGVDPECLTASLDDYCRELIAAGVAHSYDVVPAAIATCAPLAVAA
ncbi:hypothetical protein [Streptomyces sp. NRRL S-350]|uniref:hypothetical protein n=1 Tax=Streptomyces sp. NRRL S-350 TaxID=1463902 RepID=UPI000A8543B3|nr:hypothetical protein [Streptomyces sp. NRRL S-350]